jgi:hypothetical protein
MVLVIARRFPLLLLRSRVLRPDSSLNLSFDFFLPKLASTTGATGLCLLIIDSEDLEVPAPPQLGARVIFLDSILIKGKLSLFGQVVMKFKLH